MCVVSSYALSYIEETGELHTRKNARSGGFSFNSFPNTHFKCVESVEDIVSYDIDMIMLSGTVSTIINVRKADNISMI